MTVYIYDLSDPRTGCVRYVGKSVNPTARLATHIREARRGNPVHSKRWIDGLLKHGLRPVLSILEEVPDEKANEAEMFWIASLKLAGADLTNRTNGGDGQSKGYQWSTESKQKLSNSIKGKKRSDEQKQRMREAFNRPEVRRKRSDITRARMADPAQRAVAQAGMRGKKMTEEAKRKISEKWTAERKAKHAAEKRSLPFDDRWKSQLSAALKARWNRYRALKAVKCSL